MLPRLCGDEFLEADLIEQRQVVADQRPHDLCRNAFVIVAQYVPDTSNFAPRMSGWRAFKLDGNRRLASEMISTPRSTSHNLRQSPSKTSRGTPAISLRIWSMASDDVRQARDWRWLTSRNLQRHRLDQARAGSCAGFRGS